jgi:hypothetical protein
MLHKTLILSTEAWATFQKAISMIDSFEGKNPHAYIQTFTGQGGEEI